MIIFTDGGKFPATKEMIGFPQVTKILSKFSLRTKIKVNISTKLYRFPPIRQDSWTGRKSCESKGGVVSPPEFSTRGAYMGPMMILHKTFDVRIVHWTTPSKIKV